MCIAYITKNCSDLFKDCRGAEISRLDTSFCRQSNFIRVLKSQNTVTISFFSFWQNTTTFLLVIFRPKLKRKRWKRHFSHLGTFREFIIIKSVFLFLSEAFLFRDCRVVRDPQTLKSKGYGFVSFVKKTVSKLYYKLLLPLFRQFVSTLLKGLVEKSH